MRHVCSAPQLGKKLIGFDASPFFDGPLGHRKPNAHKNEAEEGGKGKDLLFRTCTGKTFFLWSGEAREE